MSLRDPSRIAYSTWIEFWKPLPSRTVRLFCFHHAGGSALLFRDWQHRMAGSIEVCPVQFPGRGKRLQHRPSIDLLELSEAAACGIEPLIEGPFALFGYSMGGYVAFEVARRLERRGFAPLNLFIAGAAAPNVRRHNTDTWMLSRAELIQKLRSLNGTPPAVLASDDLMDMFIPIIRSDFQAVETYCPSPGTRVNCAISGFAGTLDCEAPPEAVAAWSAYSWRAFSCTCLAGDHSFVLKSSSELLHHISAAFSTPQGNRRNLLCRQTISN